MIDLIMYSASRKRILEKTIGSLSKFLVTRKKLRKVLHEDMVYPEKSDYILKSTNIVNYFDETSYHNPPLGVGKSIEWCLLNKVKTDFIIHGQDDYELEIPIDIDHIIFTMKKKNISHVVFYKTILKNKDVNFCHLPLTQYNKGSFASSIGNMNFIGDNWNIFLQAFNKDIKQEKKLNKLLEGNINTYVYGPSGYPRVVNHIGLDEVVKSWGRKEDNTPGQRKGRTKGKAPGI